MQAPFSTDRFKVHEKDARETLMPYLRTNAFHVTRGSSFEKIIASGFIDPNWSATLGDTFPQSANSYGRYKGYVCLFDFQSKSDAAIDSAFDCYNFFYTRSLGDDIAILLLFAEATTQIVPASEAFSETKGTKIWIPEVECWYPGPVPLRLIERVLLVRIERTPIAEDGLLAALIAVNEKRRAKK